MKMKSLLVLLAITLLSLDVVACGGTSKGAGSVSQTSSQVAASRIATATTVSQTASAHGYLNDGDNDPSNDEDPDDRNGKKTDEDNDEPSDRVPTQNNSYHDSDDDSIVNFGYPAGAADKRAVMALTKRYYAAAAAEDGAMACSSIYSTYAESIPEDYGQAPGPSYLRGGKTCQAVMSMLFKHSHSQLTGAFDVTGVRVDGNQGIALLGSRTVPASFLTVRRERGAWKVQALIGASLP